MFFFDEIIEMCVDVLGKVLMLYDKIYGIFKKEMLFVGIMKLKSVYVS